MVCRQPHLGGDLDQQPQKIEINGICNRRCKPKEPNIKHISRAPIKIFKNGHDFDKLKLKFSKKIQMIQVLPKFPLRRHGTV